MPIAFIASANADYLVDFEASGETKGLYASGTVKLSGLDWNLTEVVTSSLDADWKNGARSARLRGHGISKMEMLEDKADGAGTISFSYRRYGTDQQVAWRVEYSVNQGVSWTQLGSVFTAPASDTVQTFSETVNLEGDVRIRIVQNSGTGTSNRRLNVDDLLITDFTGDEGGPSEPVPPSLGPVAVSSVSFASAELTASFVANGGADFATYGFVLIPTSVSATPGVGDEGVIDLATDHNTTPIASPIQATASGLEPATEYAVRAYVIYDGGEEIVYSPSVATFSTAALPPSITADAPYSQNFVQFTSEATLPLGWSVTAANQTYSAWANTTAGIKHSSASVDVLGYQHTGSTGVVTKTLTLLNDTGDEITELFISYIGRVERLNEGRTPSFTVVVAGQTIESLAYTTAENSDLQRSASITGLSIADGAAFTISWSSDGSLEGSPGSGNRRQIGISEVVVSTQALPLDAPAISLVAGTYFESQLAFVTNLGDYPDGTEVRYTLDGTTPTASNGLVYDEDGIVVEDGNGPVTLRALAVDVDSGLSSPITAINYVFPLNVADLATLRQQPTGTAIYRVNNTMVLTGQTSFRNTKFFQDASGAGIQIDDNTALIQTAYSEGDAIESLVCRINTFQGQLQFVPLQDPGEAVSSGNVVHPVVRTLGSLGAADQALLVKIEGVEFSAADGVAVFGEGGSETPIEDASGTALHRHIFSDTDLADALLPSGVGSITGIIMQRTTGITIGARSLADLDFQASPPPPAEGDFAAWIGQFDVGGLTGPFDDAAGDGIPNILKHVLGLAPDVATTGSLVNATNASAGSITFTHTRIKLDQMASDVSVDYEWSTDLVNWSAAGGTSGGVTVSFGEATVLDGSNEDFDVVAVTATVTGGSAGKLFARIAVSLDAGDL